MVDTCVGCAHERPRGEAGWAKGFGALLVVCPACQPLLTEEDWDELGEPLVLIATEGNEA